MRKLKTAFVMAAALPIVAACSYDVDEVRNMSSEGSAYQQGLHQEYTRLAQLEYDENDWRDTRFFLERAKMSAMGEDVGPQALDERKLGEDYVSQLASARGRLVRALDAGGATAKPDAAARAQAAFDCWMQEQEENLQPNDIAACKAAFNAAMAELEAKPEPMAKAPEPAPAPVPMAAPEPRAPMVILFGFDSAALSGMANSAIKDAAAYYKDRGGQLSVMGYTDRAGSPAYNKVLSADRANSVAEGLKANGVKADDITTAGYGEDNPAVQTADNVKEVRNRRAVIVFSK